MVLLHRAGNAGCLEFFESLQDAVLAAETDYNLGDPEEEGLDPKFEQFTFVLKHVSIVLDGCGGFELNPIDWVIFVSGFAIPH